jgi:hypothetical protein
MSDRGRRLLLVACAFPLGWLLAHSVLDVGVGGLFLAPAMLLAVPLLAGRYVGADRLSRGGPARLRVRRTDATGFATRPSQITLPRGGLLIAASLAVRPPPSAITT